MTPTLVLLLAAAWLGTGLVLSFVLARRGHDAFSWFVLGTMLGPLAIILAIDSCRHDEHPARRFDAGASPTEDVPVTGGETVDVLVGFDGSDESKAALASAIELLGARLGRLTLATVIPYDGGMSDEGAAMAALRRQAALVRRPLPGLEIVRGRPADALKAEAAAGGYELLVIGTRGSGHAHLFGSAASSLARSSKVPVLLVGAT